MKANHSSTATQPASEVTLPTQRTVGDWLDALAGASIVEQINDQMTKWTAAFVDEGIAGWSMPGRDRGYYQGWRELAQRDLPVDSSALRTLRKKFATCPVRRRMPLSSA